MGQTFVHNPATGMKMEQSVGRALGSGEMAQTGGPLGLFSCLKCWAERGGGAAGRRVLHQAAPRERQEDGAECGWGGGAECG